MDKTEVMGKSDRIKNRTRLFNAAPYCYWCGKRLPTFDEIKNPPGITVTREIRKKNLESMPTIEHLIPGRDFERNLRLSCFWCNK